jgi:hypothetical protein
MVRGEFAKHEDGTSQHSKLTSKLKNARAKIPRELRTEPQCAAKYVSDKFLAWKGLKERLGQQHAPISTAERQRGCRLLGDVRSRGRNFDPDAVRFFCQIRWVTAGCLGVIPSIYIHAEFWKQLNNLINDFPYTRSKVTKYRAFFLLFAAVPWKEKPEELPNSVRREFAVKEHIAIIAVGKALAGLIFVPVADVEAVSEVKIRVLHPFVCIIDKMGWHHAEPRGAN